MILGGDEEERLGGVEGHSAHSPPVLLEGILGDPFGHLVNHNSLSRVVNKRGKKVREDRGERVQKVREQGKGVKLL